MKYLLLYLFLTFTFQPVYGHTIDSCNIQYDSHHCHQDRDQSLLDIHNAISDIQNIVSYANVRSAHCRGLQGPSLEEMQEWLNSWSNETNNSQNNISFSHETKFDFDPNESSKMIDLFKKLTKNFNPLPTNISEHIQETQTPVQSAEEVQSECSTVICTSQEIFGEKQGIQLLYMLARYGFNGSPYPFSNKTHPEIWDSEGLDKVLTALSAFPESVLPFVHNKPLVRFKRGFTRVEYNNLSSNECVSANSFIEVFDCIEQFPEEHFITTVIHEVAHVIGHEADLDKTPTWFKFSGWEETKTRQGNTINVSYNIKKPECLISEYAGTNPTEDFAESVVAYRYNPKHLKDNCLSKYLYIKDLVFNGEEFLDNTCK